MFKWHIFIRASALVAFALLAVRCMVSVGSGVAYDAGTGGSSSSGTSSIDNSSGGGSSSSSSSSSSGGSSSSSSSSGGGGDFDASMGGSSSSSSTSSSSGGVADAGNEGAAGGVTFAAVYGNIIMGNCLPCHSTGGGVKTGMLDMSSQAAAMTNLVGQKATMAACNGSTMRVVAGNSAMSILYKKISGATCGMRMPSGGKPALAAADVMTIQKWIDNGAM